LTLAYDVLVRHEVYLALKQVGRSARTRLLEFMESLSENPFQEGDSFLLDGKNRRCQVKIIGNQALCYWPDHAEKEIRVVDLIDADTLP